MQRAGGSGGKEIRAALAPCDRMLLLLPTEQTLSFRRALNFIKQSTVSWRWQLPATHSRCYEQAKQMEENTMSIIIKKTIS